MAKNFIDTLPDPTDSDMDELPIPKGPEPDAEGSISDMPGMAGKKVDIVTKVLTDAGVANPGALARKVCDALEDEGSYASGPRVTKKPEPMPKAKAPPFGAPKDKPPMFKPKAKAPPFK